MRFSIRLSRLSADDCTAGLTAVFGEADTGEAEIASTDAGGYSGFRGSFSHFMTFP